jgi:AcrR family transcriptional regulator
MEAGARTYGGVSADERRARRRRLLVEAGTEIIGNQGAANATMTAVCARAKLTERYFYESFPDLDALLLAVFEQVVEEAAEVVLAAIEASPADARGRARAAIGAFVEFLTDDPRKARIAFVEATGSSALANRRYEALSGFAGLLGEQARAFYGTPEEADRMVRLTSFMLVGGLAETLIAWLGGELDITRDELIDDCTDLFVAMGEAALNISAER